MRSIKIHYVFTSHSVGNVTYTEMHLNKYCKLYFSYRYISYVSDVHLGKNIFIHCSRILEGHVHVILYGCKSPIRATYKRNQTRK